MLAMSNGAFDQRLQLRTHALFLGPAKRLLAVSFPLLEVPRDVLELSKQMSSALRRA